MNLDPLAFSLSQINYLVANLNKKNFEQVSQELSQIISLYGLEAEKHVLRRLFSEAARTDQPGPAAGAHARLLAQCLARLLSHPAKATAICSIVDNPDNSVKKALKPTNTLLREIAALLKLTTTLDTAFSLLLKKSSANSEIGSFAGQHLNKRVNEFVQCYLDAGRGHRAERAGLWDCSPEVLQALLTSLATENFRLAAVTKDLFLNKLREDFPREVAPVVLAPLLYPDDARAPLRHMAARDELAAAMTDAALGELVRELGYCFTSSVEDCKTYMIDFQALEPSPSDVASVISTMVSFHTAPHEGPPVQTPGNFWTNRKSKKKKEPLSPGRPDAWNADVFVQTLQELAPGLDWKEVIHRLDRPDFAVPDGRGLGTLFAVLRAGLRGAGYPPDAFPVEYLCRRWTNLDAQMSLIANILEHPDVFSFADHPFHPVSIELLRSPPEIDKKEASTWRSLYLVDLLLHAADRGHCARVRELFERPTRACPDVLLLTLLHVGPPLTALRRELLTTLIPIFLGGHPNSGTILQWAWSSQNPDVKPVVMRAMAEWYARGDHDQARLSRILDVAQDLKALTSLLNVQLFPFAIDLACLAARRDYLKLDKWLADSIRDHGETFAAAAVEFLQRRCRPPLAQLPPETAATLLTCLRLCASSVSRELREAIHDAIAGCQPSLPTAPGGAWRPFAAHGDAVASLVPGVANLSLGLPPGAFAAPLATPVAPLSPFAAVPMPHRVAAVTPPPPAPLAPDGRVPEMMHNISKEIQEEASGYFQRIYNRPPHPTLSVDEALDLLKQFQESPKARDRDVFSCMLRNLFDEYRFFPQYPERDLHVNAQLYGGLIERGLAPGYFSGLTLRFVLDALRKPEGSKMYYFGIAALDRFKARLKDCHKYCEHIKAIPHYKELPPHLIQYVEYGAQSRAPPAESPSIESAPYTTALVEASAPNVASVASLVSVASVASVAAGAAGAARPSIAHATNIDTLLAATDAQRTVVAPPEAVRDKTAFIFNNLSQLNLSTKCEQLKEIITEEYYEWLTQYLVMKRASIELNFHSLYANLLDALSVRRLGELVTRETYRNIGVLLGSDKDLANFSDRSLLKNLGHWLGALTLARNRPVLLCDLDLKALLLQAYRGGLRELLYVVPFTAKVLEACADSSVFRPPNPWTMAVMRVLAELHREPDLKLNLKFEIEVLCKKLDLDINALKPALYLRDPESFRAVECERSPASPARPPPALLQLPCPAADAPAAPAAPAALLQSHPRLRQLVQPAVERSVQEWLHPVVEHALRYALPACERLVRKDFALEPDEACVRAAAQRMARGLVAAVAAVTCRERLPDTLAADLQAAFGADLLPATAQQKDTIESGAALLAAESAELACAVIQRSAVEKALPELDKRLAADYEARRLARREGRGPCDPAVLRYQAERLPERLRLRAGGPSARQLAVYEQFGEPAARAQEPPFPPVDPAQAYGSELSALLSAVQTFVSTAQNSALATNMHQLLACLALLARSRDVVSASTLLQRAVDGLLDGSVPSGASAEHAEQLARYRELHVRVLGLLAADGAHGRAWVREHVTRVLCACSGERCYNLDAVNCLVRNQLIDLSQYDVALARLLDSGRDYVAASFALQLLRLLEPAALPHCAAALALLTHGKPPEPRAAVDDAPGYTEEPPPGPAAHIHDGILLARAGEAGDPPGLQESSERLMREWRGVLQGRLSDAELARSFPLYVQRMSAAGVLASDDTLARFLRRATAGAARDVRRLLREEPPPARHLCYEPCDSLVKLVTLLVKNTADGADPAPRLNLLNKVLGIIAGCLLRDHELRGVEFEQLPYHRLLLILFLDMTAPEPVLESMSYQIVSAFCHTLLLLRPSEAPGFCYAWLEVVAHRAFIHKVLAATPQQKGWGMYAALLVALLAYLAPYLRRPGLAAPVARFYRGALRLLLVLLHDFPELLCDHHHALCDEIPPNCVQLRNLVLSAYPRDMRLPDPFTPNLKVDLLAEIGAEPRCAADYTALVPPSPFRTALDAYLHARAPVAFLSEMRGHLQPAGRPDARLVSAAVLHVGARALAQLAARGLAPSVQAVAHCAHMDVFQTLTVSLDHAGQYLFLNALADQLRYPSRHTHYFSCVLLYLFGAAHCDALRERITRTLLERLVANRPHPWGLLVTFIELLKNPVYKFWSYDFVRCAPEIEKLFVSVASSCGAEERGAADTSGAAAAAQPAARTG